MNEKSTTSTVLERRDSDDAPRITAAWAEQAELRVGDNILREASPRVRIGRPKKDPRELKKPVSLRLSGRLLEAARATGPGWQKRAVAAIEREFLGEEAIIDQAPHKGPRASMADLGRSIVEAVKAVRSSDNKETIYRKKDGSRETVLRSPTGQLLNHRSSRNRPKKRA